MAGNPSADGGKSDSSSVPIQGTSASIKGGSARPRGSKTICIPCEPKRYGELVKDDKRFRRYVDALYARHPELFPAAMSAGYRWHDIRAASVKLGLRLRRIKLVATGDVYSVCPSFVMPYMVGYTAEVEDALFLEEFGVPYWALTHVFGRNDMYWYRLTAAFGRNSIVGTTVKHPEALPKDLLGDEKHSRHAGEKVYLATTVGKDCVLGAAMCAAADSAALTQGYGVFAEEARNLAPHDPPETVNTDGWGATRLAWEALFPQIVIIQCFLHRVELNSESWD